MLNLAFKKKYYKKIHETLYNSKNLISINLNLIITSFIGEKELYNIYTMYTKCLKENLK